MQTGTELTVTRGTKPMLALNTKSLNWDTLEQMAKVFAPVSGLPGTLLLFKKGKWYAGHGKDQVKIKLGTELIANVPNIMFAWRKWDDGKPVMPHMCYPLVGEVLPERSELGDLDKSLWEVQTDDNGKPRKDEDGNTIPVDPWKLVVILMMRDEDGELYRFETDTPSGRASVGQFVAEYAKQGRKHMDKLPIVALGSDERTQKGTRNTYDIPAFEIVGWAEPTEEDFPEGGVSFQKLEEAEAGETERKARSSKKATRWDEEDDEEETDRLSKSKVTNKKAAKARADDDDDEDEEEEVETRRPPRAPASRSRSRSRDDDDEDEDEVPRGRKVAKRRGDDDDDDEEDEGEIRPARRRLTRH